MTPNQKIANDIFERTESLDDALAVAKKLKKKGVHPQTVCRLLRKKYGVKDDRKLTEIELNEFKAIVDEFTEQRIEALPTPHKSDRLEVIILCVIAFGLIAAAYMAVTLTK